MDCPSNIVNFDADKTSVTLLQDVLNKQGVRTVQYELLQIEGAISAPSFQYRVTDGRFVAYGQGKSKKEAKQNAAKALLRIIHKEFPDLCSGPLLESQIHSSLDINEKLESINFGDNDERNPIGMLQELCTSLHLPPPVYITECEDGLPHKRLFTVSCNVSEYKQTGTGKSKKIAKRLAANNLYLLLKSIQADLSLNCQPAENVEDFVRQESCNLSGLKNSKSSSQFHRLPEIHRHLPLTEGPYCNNLKNMTDEELYSCDSFRPDHVISKYKNLWSLFCQELKKIETSENSRTSVKHIYAPHVIWFSRMDSFLKPYVTMKDTCSNYVTPIENNRSDIERTDCKNQIMNVLNESFQEQFGNNEVELNLTKPVPSTTANINTNSTVIKKKVLKSPQKRETLRSSSSETDTVLAAVEQLNSIAERAQQLNKKEDSFDQFGKYIASVLRDIPLKKACLLQQSMTNMIMNEIIENNNANAVHEQQRSPSTNTITSDFGSPAMF